MNARRPAAVACSCALLLALAAQSPAPAPRHATADDLVSIEKYIHQSWHTLTRSNAQLAAAAVDPKFNPEPDGRWPVYVSKIEDLQAVQRRLRREMPAAAFAKIDLRRLAETGQAYEQPGLLYLPLPYVVPGGRFNEMYGWDSYFIQVGLLREGRPHWPRTWPTISSMRSATTARS